MQHFEWLSLYEFETKQDLEEGTPSATHLEESARTEVSETLFPDAS